MGNRSTVVCFGEVLWDSTPKGLFLGGAPTNVAFHVQQLGLEAVPATAVGDDFLGEEIRRRMTNWGVNTEQISTIASKKTGVVQVDLTKPTNPVYEIVDDVAWDYIPATESLFTTVSEAQAFVFGSLALRRRHNSLLIDELLPAARGFKIFDVNLRAPFYDAVTIHKLALKADLVKVNEDELEVLHPYAVGSVEVMAAAFAMTIGGASVCVTCGSQGAGLWRDGKWYWEDARPVAARGDAVGAGDAFLAGLISGLVADRPADLALSRACRLAEFVAGSDGAQPAYDPSILSAS